MSATQYAQHRNVSTRAVSLALKTGRIQRNAAGLIDSESADRDWEKNTNPRMAAAGKRNGLLGQAMQRARLAAGMPEGGSNQILTSAGEGKVPPTQDFSEPSDMAQYSKARAIRESYIARLAKLEFEEKSGKLISAAEIKTAAYTRDRILRDLLMAIPDRISAELAAEESAANCHRLLEQEIRTVLDKVAAMKTVMEPRRGIAYGNAG